MGGERLVGFLGRKSSGADIKIPVMPAKAGISGEGAQQLSEVLFQRYPATA